jgi:hypothetical protein
MNEGVYRVPGFFLQSSELAPPAPSPASECCPPFRFREGGGGTLACERGGEGSKVGRRDRHSGTLGIVQYTPSIGGEEGLEPRQQKFVDLFQYIFPLRVDCSGWGGEEPKHPVRVQE